jgi:hypothetical protein
MPSVVRLLGFFSSGSLTLSFLAGRERWRRRRRGGGGGVGGHGRSGLGPSQDDGPASGPLEAEADE